MNILLVEDDPSLSLLLQQMLIKYGHSVTSASSAEDAWELYLANDYPLIILDWVLPGLSGIDFCRRIRSRADGQYSYIWVITAKNKREDLLAVLEAGASDYLAKPIDIALLEVRVNIAVQQVAHLQQRKQSEEALSRSQAELEQKVIERTQALSESIDALESEVNQRIETEDLLAQTRDQLRALASHLVSIQEQQQKRISREIHDELGQAMTALKIDLGWLAKQLEPHQDDALQKIARMIPLVSDTIKTIQRICAELRPGILDDLGLIAAIEWMIQEFQERTGLDCNLLIQPEDFDVSAAQATALFRICQESLTNVMRHAQASKVEILMTLEEEQLKLSVHDNGIGLPAEMVSHPQSLGLMGMRERVLPWDGEVLIQSAVGDGTCITVSLKHEVSK